MPLKQRKIDTILKKYDGIITSQNDLTAGNPPSALFYILADKLSYLLTTDSGTAIHPKRNRINVTSRNVEHILYARQLVAQFG